MMVAGLRAMLATALVSVTWAGVPAAAGETAGPGLVVTRDLAADGETARAAGVPILLAVTREDCRYCEKLKHYVLVPMLRSGEYRDKVLIRELVIEPSIPVRGFDGRQVDSLSIAEVLEATLSPTVLLLDPSGRPVEPPIRGVNDVEFYGYYLDQAIERALASVRSGADTGNKKHGT